MDKNDRNMKNKRKHQIPGKKAMLRRRNYLQKSLPPIRCNKGPVEKKRSKIEERGLKKDLSQILERERNDPRLRGEQLRKPTKTESRDGHPPRKSYQIRREMGGKIGNNKRPIIKIETKITLQRIKDQLDR